MQFELFFYTDKESKIAELLERVQKLEFELK